MNGTTYNRGSGYYTFRICSHLNLVIYSTWLVVKRRLGEANFSSSIISRCNIIIFWRISLRAALLPPFQGGKWRDLGAVSRRNEHWRGIWTFQSDLSILETQKTLDGEEVVAKQVSASQLGVGHATPWWAVRHFVSCRRRNGCHCHRQLNRDLTKQRRQRQRERRCSCSSLHNCNVKWQESAPGNDQILSWFGNGNGIACVAGARK